MPFALLNLDRRYLSHHHNQIWQLNNEAGPAIASGAATLQNEAVCEVSITGGTWILKRWFELPSHCVLPRSLSEQRMARYRCCLRNRAITCHRQPDDNRTGDTSQLENPGIRKSNDLRRLTVCPSRNGRSEKRDSQSIAMERSWPHESDCKIPPE